MVSPLARRSAVKYLTKTGKCSERRACVVVGLSRSLVRYIARRSKDEAALIVEFARRYYENKQAEEATQPGEMAGTLSL